MKPKTFELKDYPSPPCIYLLLDGDEIVYIGQTKVSWLGRAGVHQRDKKFDAIIIDDVPAFMLNEREAELIVKHRPKYNTDLPYNSKYMSKDRVYDEYNINSTKLMGILLANPDKNIMPWPHHYDIELILDTIEDNHD